MGVTTAGTSRVQAYETLRELVRKVECGEIEILDMSIEQNAPETRDFQAIGGRMPERMLVRNGDISVNLRLALTSISEPGYISRDEAGRLRGAPGIPRDPRTGQFGNATSAGPAVRKVAMKDYSAMTRDELLQVAGMSREDFKRVQAEIEAEEFGAAKYGDPTFEGVNFPRPQTTEQAPVNPLDYGARKVDID